MIGWWVLGGLAVVALASAIWPQWAGIFLPRPSRIPGASPRRLHAWPVRATSAAVLAVLATIATQLLWPEDTSRELAVSGVLAVCAVALGIWFLAAALARRDRESREQAEDAANLHDAASRANHPERDGYETVDEVRVRIRRRETPGYGFEVASVAVAAITVLVAGGLLASNIGAVGDPGSVGDPDAAAEPTESEDPAWEIIRTFNTLHRVGAPLAEAPATGSVVDAWWYAEVDADARLPAIPWRGSSGANPVDVLDGVELVIKLPAMVCRPVGVIVIETETTVTVGIAVEQTPPTPTPTLGPDGVATPAPTPTSLAAQNPCLHVGSIRSEWFPVDLAAPLGDRTVQNYGGRHLSVYRAPDYLPSG